MMLRRHASAMLHADDVCAMSAASRFRCCRHAAAAADDAAADILPPLFIIAAMIT